MRYDRLTVKLRLFTRPVYLPQNVLDTEQGTRALFCHRSAYLQPWRGWKSHNFMLRAVDC